MYHNFFIYLSVDQHLGYFHVLAIVTEKAVAPHSSTLAQKIPWTEEPGGLQSTGSRRVGHDWATSLSLFTFMHWRRKWQPTPVFLPRESQGWGNLVGFRLWGHSLFSILGLKTLNQTHTPQKTILSTMNYLGTSVENKLAIYVWDCIYVF